MDNFNEFTRYSIIFLSVSLFTAGLCKAVYELWKVHKIEKESKKWREVPKITWNDQGMAKITDVAVTTTPITMHNIEAVGLSFPEELAGFIANLTPNEVSTILLDVMILSNRCEGEAYKDIMRAVTIAAARYGFQIPIALVCLDARTHALYVVLNSELEMRKIDQDLICNMGLPPPAHFYIEGTVLAGQVLMHYASKGPYPHVNNFIKTYNKNYKGKEKLHKETILSMVTAYAAITKMPLPHNYHKYNELTDAIFYSKSISEIVEETKPHLTLVK